MREFVNSKFGKLEHYYDRINQVYIVLKVEKVTQIAEATLHVNGGELHATAEAEDMYAAIDGLVEPAKPLSDSKLTAMLSEQGIMVARRTVAKYRESLSIPPSNQRKQLV
ncbi:ribosomal subunit interface protein [Pantoea sp. BRM17]|nr:ribosomal subunit interface protein [Pantoea sp. BRM17]